MIGDQQHPVLTSWMGKPATPPFPVNLERYEQMQPCWETRDAVFFRGCVKGQEQRVLARLPKLSRGERNSDIGTLRGYRIAQNLRSTFSAKVFALEASDVGPVIVYVDEEARPLALLVQTSPALSEVLAISAAFAKGLSDLHTEGLVHANLNLDNVWLCPETGSIRISDFALSRHPAIEAPTTLPFERDPRFVAPEQTSRMLQPIDQRTDIYAFGVILFYLLTGQVPFAGNDTMSILDRHLTASVTFPSELQALIPGPLVQLVLKCLEKNSEDRYGSASGLRADLLECGSQLLSSGTISDFALGRHDPRVTFRIPTSLYGRETETSMLRRFVRSRQRRPAVMLVTGSAGVGKTAFLNQLADIVLKENGRFITGKFDQYRRNVPYISLVQAFQDLIHQLLAQPEAELADCRERLLAACEGNARVILDVIPDIELIIGPQPPVASLPPLEARNRFNRVFRNVILALASSDNPLALFMDDLQWADSASLELLATVLSELDTRCLIFVAAYRDNEASPQLETAIKALELSGINCQRVILKAIELSDVVQLVRDTIGGLAEEILPLAEVLYSRTQGNPLYLTQLLHFLHDSQLISFDYSAGRWQWDLQRIRAGAVTDDVLDLLHLRISGLPAKTRHLLSVAACLGSTFDTGRLACAAVQSDFISDLMACVQSDLIIAVDDVDSAVPPTQMYPESRFRFLHDRIQQAAFDLVTDDVRTSLRLQIGRRLLSRLTPEEKAVPQIDVLNNFNYAWQLIRDPAERKKSPA